MRGKILASSDLTSAIAGSGSASAASGFSYVPWTTKSKIFRCGNGSPRWRDSGDNLDRLNDPEISRRRVDGEGLQLEHLLPSPVSPPLLSFSSDIEASWSCRHYERCWVIKVVLSDRNDLLERLRPSCCRLPMINIRIRRDCFGNSPAFPEICELSGFQCFQ